MKHPETMNRPSELRQDYDKVWTRWAAEQDLDLAVAEHRLSRRPFLDLLRGLIAALPGRAALAELGCGTAIDLAILSQELKAPLFVASDISFRAMTIARGISSRLDADLRCLASDLARCPFGDASLDLVFTQGVLEHFPDPLPLFREQIRILREGGTLVVNVPQRYTGYTLHKRRAMRRGEWTLGWETEFSCAELRRIGRQLGLMETGVMGYGYWLSRSEPLFVLRDLAGKVYRALALPRTGPAGLPLRLYDGLWGFLERHWGHYFMKNLVVVFRKPPHD